MLANPYSPLEEGGYPLLAELAWQRLKNNTHGDLSRWLEAIDEIPDESVNHDAGQALLDCGAPVLGLATEDSERLNQSLFALHPWRKGPLSLGGIQIDTEWRSDWKWDRIAPHLDLKGQEVLDIGCGNGYFGLRMLGAGADMVVGIDPTMVFVMQWLAMQKLAPGLKNFVLPMGVEHLPADSDRFDTVFSMGVLYHRRDPLQHLQQLKQLTRPGGHILLETLVLEGNDTEVLVPEGRYARMRNVHAIPSLRSLESWLGQVGLSDMQVLDVSRTTVDEQRSTDWMTFESLQESLDKQASSLTVEGHPAPIRAAILLHV